jgi:hypothetical protein
MRSLGRVVAALVLAAAVGWVAASCGGSPSGDGTAGSSNDGHQSFVAVAPAARSIAFIEWTRSGQHVDGTFQGIGQVCHGDGVSVGSGSPEGLSGTIIGTTIRLKEANASALWTGKLTASGFTLTYWDANGTMLTSDFHPGTEHDFLAAQKDLPDCPRPPTLTVEFTKNANACPDGERVSPPWVEGQRGQPAVKRLAKAGFEVQVSKKAAPSIGRGVVFIQFPPRTEKVCKGSPVRFDVFNLGALRERRSSWFTTIVGIAGVLLTGAVVVRMRRRRRLG